MPGFGGSLNVNRSCVPLVTSGSVLGSSGALYWDRKRRPRMFFSRLSPYVYASSCCMSDTTVTHPLVDAHLQHPAYARSSFFGQGCGSPCDSPLPTMNWLTARNAKKFKGTYLFLPLAFCSFVMFVTCVCSLPYTGSQFMRCPICIDQFCIGAVPGLWNVEKPERLGKRTTSAILHAKHTKMAWVTPKLKASVYGTSFICLY